MDYFIFNFTSSSITEFTKIIVYSRQQLMIAVKSFDIFMQSDH